jgi:hypothetical protein
VRAAPRPLPAPVEMVHVSRAIDVRERESASSLEALLGCSLAYVLRYAGVLAPGLSAPAAAPGPLLCGNLVHHVLARVFACGVIEPDAAAQRAAALVDEELPRLAETLLLADHQAERAAARRAIVESARAVAACIRLAGSTIRGVEVPLEGRIGRVTLVGRADLLLAEPDHVIDFKWGAARHRDMLRAGAAVQLALYAELARTGPSLPGAAYLLARTGRLVAARGAPIPGASVPTAYALEETLRAAEAAIERRLGELAAGELVAPGAIEDAPASQLAGGVLRVEPGCARCELDGLCGRGGRT